MTRSARHSSLFLLAVIMPSASAWAAETSYRGGAGLSYKYDDNAGVRVDDPISLGGWILNGSLVGAYATPRLKLSGDLRLSLERYNHVEQDTDNPPDAARYNKDNTRLGLGFGYSWELHQVGLNASYRSDSALNGAFLDTGNIENGQRKDYGLGGSWQWQLTERQTLNSGINGTTVFYQGGNGVDYNNAAMNVGWSYALSERTSLQLQSSYSWFRNQADISVKSQSFALQGGFFWSLAEKWRLDALVGSTKVYTVYGEDGFLTIDPGTGQIEFVEIEDQDSSSFTGNISLAFNEEHYGVNASVNSGVYPSGNGVLENRSRGRVALFWTPKARIRFDFDGVVGRDSASDDRLSSFDSNRVYQEVGMRFAYQFLEQWWVNARYRHRAQRRDNSETSTETAKGNSVFIGVSYSLPKELFW